MYWELDSSGKFSVKLSKLIDTTTLGSNIMSHKFAWDPLVPR